MEDGDGNHVLENVYQTFTALSTKILGDTIGLWTIMGKKTGLWMNWITWINQRTFYYSVCSVLKRAQIGSWEDPHSRCTGKLRNGTIRVLVENIATGHTPYRTQLYQWLLFWSRPYRFYFASNGYFDLICSEKVDNFLHGTNADEKEYFAKYDPTGNWFSVESIGFPHELWNCSIQSWITGSFRYRKR